MIFLQGHGVSTTHATKVFKTYGNDSIKTVQENPYKLADDIWGIGFKTADTIAEKLGFDHDREERLRSGILYTLNKLSEEGHCFAEREQLFSTGAELLTVEAEKLSGTLDRMIEKKDVITEDAAIYLPPFYFSEVGTARRLKQIYSAKRTVDVGTIGLEETISRATGMTYDPVQIEAIKTAVQSKILILTGGPGTGKTTTTTLGIITAFRSAGASILLAAPTGRAAKRLSEATGMEAKTIHRMLEVKPPDGYQKNEENPLEGDVLILDECSMIDIMLMYNLLKAVPDSMTIIFVGDIDQLPSVGAGNVLRDIIESGAFPVVRLTKIFRQAQQSRIIMNAHRINKGEMSDLSNGKNTDFFFMERDEPEVAAATIVELVKTKLPAYYHVPSSGIQVLTPMQRGVVGAANLNQVLQEAINPGTEGLQRGGIHYRTGDKVMQIRNNYDKEVFNGDIGTVTSVDTIERELTVDFDGRSITYDVSELDELVLAYATTIHKSQGCEYPIVVMPVLMTHYVMLQRNLVYTGVTRAKKVIIVVGTKKTLGMAIRNVTVTRRNTMLAQRLGGSDTNKQEKAEAKPRKELKAESAQDSTPKTTSTPAEPDKPTHQDWLKTDLFQRIAQSKFRSGFHLSLDDKVLIEEKGFPVIRKHAENFIENRLSPAEPKNDGKQTPMKGHPVFVAQHATGTCCRDCLWKWHGIEKGRALTEKEQAYIVDVIMKWIVNQR